MRYASQITLKQLRALRAVAAENTISAAALQLGLTGPAVHSQLKSLEEIVGCSLLSREGSDRNAATPQGQALLDAYAEITASLDRAVHQIVALNQGQSGRVVLGVVSTGKYFAPKIVAMLQREMPGIEVSLVIGNRGETIEDLKRGAFDLCIMGRPPARAFDRRDHAGRSPPCSDRRPRSSLGGPTACSPRCGAERTVCHARGRLGHPHSGQPLSG